MTTRSSFFSAALLWLLVSLCTATITITETGEHFASRPDLLVGTRFLEGYEYMARLQVFLHNMELCPPSSPLDPPLNLTVLVPPDGLPVAILAKSGGCSLETKARLASFAVEPPHKLKYLIVVGESKLELLQDEQVTSHQQEAKQEATPSRLLRTPDRRRRPDDGISVGILHVNEGSGNELLRTVLAQSPGSLENGGPRILLDGRDSRGSFARDFLLWMGISVLMMACLFSFLLSARAQQEGIAAAAHVTTREAPRRLTAEQVSELLPEVLYGTLELHDEHMPGCCEELCSICLDEYQVEDKCRCLPCAHVFHSKCISKWLMERSSTCPLCKTDLLQLQDESDDDESDYVELREGGTQTDEDVANHGSIFRFMDRMVTSVRSTSWRRRRQQQQEQREQQVTTEDEVGVSQQPLLESEDSDSQDEA